MELALRNTAGRKTRLVLNPDVRKEVIFTAEGLENYQVNTRSSLNDMKKLSNFLRSYAGKKSVPTSITNHLSRTSKKLQDLYKEGIFEFDTEKSTQKAERAVVWADASELLETIFIQRNIIGNYLVKVMADGGQGFCKISMTVLPENYSELEFTTSHDSDTYLQPKRRKLYSEGGSVANKGKLTSVNRLIMLCSVPNIKETYAKTSLRILTQNNSFNIIDE